MPDLKISSNWMAVILSSLFLLGTMAATYNSITTDIAVVSTKVDVNKSVNEAQDSYDALLSDEIDKNSMRLIKNETEQDALKETQEDMRNIMRDMLKEMKQMNENLIRLESE